MKENVSVFWFRRDLRLYDNAGLYMALKNIAPVLPVFIFDTEILDKEILDKLPRNDARVSFIYQSLQNMRKKLQREAGSSIAVYHGNPLKIFKKITENYHVKVVFTNNDYEPYARKRDEEVAKFLNSREILFLTFKDHVIFEKDEVVKDNGSPYVVYTPYSKKWLKKLEETQPVTYNTKALFRNLIKDTALPNVSLSEIRFKVSVTKIPDYNINHELIAGYETTRNYPALNHTSKLGPHLRFGTVSIREIVSGAKEHQDITFLKALIWREFFMQILWHFPHTATKSFKPAYDRIQWRNNEEEFKKWCDGQTGYPLVDAGMRQLNKTGFMHNRVRMLAGSFLCKHLLIDWRWGEAYFAEKLLDYEMASNVGNWQWVAGCGVDAAPYFRIFNPTTQIKKFDKDLNYINKWVKNINKRSYPKKIVEHQMARARCLDTYKTAIH